MDKKIEEFSEVELKAIWFDQLAIIEQAQTNISAIKKEFERRKPQPSTPEKASSEQQSDGQEVK